MLAPFPTPLPAAGSSGGSPEDTALPLIQIQRRPQPAIHGLSVLDPRLARIYAARGIASPDELDHSLHGLPSWETLLYAREAGQLLADAVIKRRKMLIIGDFDADGATSTALAMRFFRSLNAAIHFLVPDRFIFGYGLTPPLVDKAIAEYTPEILITVDNGITSIEGVQHAKAQGLQVVITDHHLPGTQLPEADWIVNPHQPGDHFPGKALAGVGVIFYVLSATRAALAEQGYFLNHPKPPMAQWLDLVAVGTVADVVPLDRINRILVSQGLERIRKGQCTPGVQALLRISRRNLAHVTSTDLGFSVGPRLNAAGRLDDMSIGIACLIALDHDTATRYATRLHRLNENRKVIEKDMHTQALAALEHLPPNTLQTADPSTHHPHVPVAICLYDPAWHAGIVGLLAGRIKERYHRPVFAFAAQDPKTPQGWLKGSGRSIPGLHLRDTLAEIHRRYPDLLDKFGGHAMAAGVTLAAPQFQAFSQAFEQVVRETLDPTALEPVWWTDGPLDQDAYHPDWVRILASSGPWGAGFPEPLFDDQFTITGYQILQATHLRLTLQHPDHREPHEAIYFHYLKKSWDPRWKTVHAVFRIQLNHYGQRERVQLVVEDLHPQ